MKSLRLAINQIRSHARKLTTASGTYVARGATFTVYRAKGLWDPHWLSVSAKSLVTEARYSYSRYGYRPPLDELDPKAAIYLVKAVYHDSHSGRMIEEWLSNRFVPGWGEPLGACEPEIFFYQGKSIDRWLKKLVCDNRRDYWRQLLSYSRMCRVLPYTQDRTPKTFDKFLSDRLRYTPTLFALTCEQFIRDYVSGNHPWKVITGIIGDEFVNKGLVVHSHDKEYKPTFTKAHKFLKVSKKAIALNRNVYTYEFPLYWLNVHELAQLLNKLHQRRVLTIESFEYYLRVHVNVRNLEHDKIALGKLGNLLSVRGQIVGSAITGEELRALVDKRVNDGPQLRITTIDDMIKSTNAILKTVGVKKTE